ncbi:hypothetical protein COV82_00480 [Candidatus Peregrinibacteria bacterium CG11_big_fil_rev_8_21_14_0_20_46_8]|nr:MAG: hypothetical protein COV82_00480 [Candidatus Peregrinibacteria bacterium CG11_big_fil_rev_8_21_14_0_20_46_8]
MKTKISGWIQGIVGIALLAFAIIGLHQSFAATVEMTHTVSDSTASASADHTISFTVANTVTSGGYFYISYSNFTDTGLDYQDYDVLVNDVQRELTSYPPSGGADSISSGGNGIIYYDLGSDINAGDTVEIRFGLNATYGATGDAQYTNPSSAGDYTTTMTSTGGDDASATVTITSGGGGSFTPADELDNTTPSEVSNHTITFSPTVDIPPSGRIELLFNSFSNTDSVDYTDVDFSVNSIERSINSFADSFSDGVDFSAFPTVSITLNSSTGITAGDSVAILIGTNALQDYFGDVQLYNPSTKGITTVDVTTYDEFSAQLETASAPINIADAGGAAGFLPSIFLTDSSPSAASDQIISISPTIDIPPNGRIDLVFNSFSNTDFVDYTDFDLIVDDIHRSVNSFADSFSDGIDVSGFPNVSITLNSSTGITAGQLVDIYIGTNTTQDYIGDASLYNPSLEGDTTVDVTTYDEFSAQLETGSATASILNEVVLFSVTSIPDDTTTSAATNHSISFWPTQDIPAAGGFFEITFANGYADTDFIGIDDIDVLVDDVQQSLASFPGTSDYGVSISFPTITIQMSDTTGITSGQSVEVRIGTNATSGSIGDTLLYNPSVAGDYINSVTTYDNFGVSMDSANYTETITEAVGGGDISGTLTHTNIDSTTSGEASDIRINFTTIAEIPASGYIVITLDPGFTAGLGLDYTDVDLLVDLSSRDLGGAPAGSFVDAVTIDSNTVTIELQSSSPIPAASAVEITIGLSSIYGGSGDAQYTNPSSASTYNTLVVTQDSLGSTLDSGNTTIDITSAVINPGDVTSTLSHTLSSSDASTSTDMTISFNTVNAIPAGGTIVYTLDSGFVPASGMDYTDVDFAVDFFERNLAASADSTNDGVAIIDNTIIVALNSSTGISAGSNVELRVGTNASSETFGDLQYTTPSTSGSKTTSIQTQNASSSNLDSGSTTVTINAGIGDLSSTLSDTLSTSETSQPANHTLAFTTVNAIPADGYIAITLDPSFSQSGFLDYTDIDLLVDGISRSLSSFASTTEDGVSVSNNAITIQLNSSSGISAGSSVSIRIGTNAVEEFAGDDQYTNPVSASTYTTTVTTQNNVTATTIDTGSTTNTITTVNSIAVTDSAPDDTESANTNHTLSFTTTSKIPAGGHIIVAFDSSFTPEFGLDYTDVDLTVNGSPRTLAATASTSEDGVSITGTTFDIELNSSTSINAGMPVDITIGLNALEGATGDRQMTNPATAGDYTITITTQNDAGSKLDEGSTTMVITTASSTGTLTVTTTSSNTAAGEGSNWTFGFTTVNDIPASGQIIVVFAPDFENNDFTFSSALDAGDVDLLVTDSHRKLAATATSTEDGVTFTSPNVVIIDLNSTTGISAGSAVEIRIGAHANKGALGDAQIINPPIEDNVLIAIATIQADQATTIDQGVSSLGIGPPFSSSTYTFTGFIDYVPPPYVTGTVPFHGGNIAENGSLIISFSVPLDSNALQTENFRLFALNSFGETTGSNLLTSTSGWTTTSSGQTTRVRIPLPESVTSGNTYTLEIQGDNDTDPRNGSCGFGLPEACVVSNRGIALEREYQLDFSTAANDSTGPQIESSYPQEGATVDRRISDMIVTFNEPIDGTRFFQSFSSGGSVTNLNVGLSLYLDNGDSTFDRHDDTLVTNTSGLIEGDGRAVHVYPNALLAANSTYFLVTNPYNSAWGIADAAGNAATQQTITFTTNGLIDGSANDTTAPSVTSINGDNDSITVYLSEPMPFDAAKNYENSTSSGSSDVNNFNNWTIETSFDDGQSWNVHTPFDQVSVVYDPIALKVKFSGIGMPPLSLFRVTPSTFLVDYAGNAMDSASNTLQAIVNDINDANYDYAGTNLDGTTTTDGTDWYNWGISPVNTWSESNVAGATTKYWFYFEAGTTIPENGTIELAFPSGFTFPSSCNTWSTTDFANTDINGWHDGTVTVASISCDSSTRKVTITINGTDINAGDFLEFNFPVTNSPVAKDYNTTGYTIDITTKNSGGTTLETKTTMPFFILAAGSSTISGYVFVDDGASGGTAGDKLPNGGEARVESAKVCLSGPTGYECKTTDADGYYTFPNLYDNSYYFINMELPTNSSYLASNTFKDIYLASGESANNSNFTVSAVSSQNILDVYLSGGSGLANKKVDVYAFRLGDVNERTETFHGGDASTTQNGSFAAEEFGSNFGGYIPPKTVTLNGSGIGTTTLSLAKGKWMINVGPSFSGTSQTVDFVPPAPEEVVVTSQGVVDKCTSGSGATDNELCFTITAATYQIKGKVVDGNGAAIKSAYVNAHPLNFGEQSFWGGFAQSDTNGLFTINVTPGTYDLHAFKPGMPESNFMECDVKDNESTSDGNSTADVYCDSEFIENNVGGFSSATLSGTANEDDLVLVIAKPDTSVSGKVLDDAGNAISYSYVTANQVNADGEPIGGWTGASTDANGNYTLFVSGGTSGSPKRWKISAFAQSSCGAMPSITVSVVAGTNLTSKNIQSQSDSCVTISGTVYIDSNGNNSVDSGEGAGNSFVNAWSDTTGGYNSAFTSSDGTYTMQLAAGSGYNVEGFIPSQGPTQSLSSQTYSSNTTGVNLKTAKTGTVVVYACTLNDPDSDPSASNGCASNTVSDGWVSAFDSSGRSTGTSSSDPGVYEFSVPEGTYTIEGNHHAIGFLGQKENVSITGGATTYVNFSQSETYSISGTVSSTSTSCVGGAAVYIYDGDTGRSATTEVNDDGTWSIANVPEGSFAVTATKAGCTDSEEPSTVTIDGASASGIERVLVRANATITGRVWKDDDSDGTLDTTENVNSDTVVQASLENGQTTIANVDLAASDSASTNYTLSLTPGTWTITAIGDGFKSASTTVTLAEGDATTQNLELLAIAGYTRREQRTQTLQPSRGAVVRDAGVEINFPAGALGNSQNNDGSVVVKETTAVPQSTSTYQVIGGKGIEVTSTVNGQPVTTLQTSGGSAATISMTYADSDIPSDTTEAEWVRTIKVCSFKKNSQNCTPLPTTCDIATNTCVGKLSSLSKFTLVAAREPGDTVTSPHKLLAKRAEPEVAAAVLVILTAATCFYVSQSKRRNRRHAKHHR